MSNEPFSYYDSLPPEIRKAVRETGKATADVQAYNLLRKGASIGYVLEVLREQFDPICADLPEATGGQ